MKPIISVENLGKRYRIGRREAAYVTVRESLTEAVKSPIRRIGRALKPGRSGSGDSEGHIWALKDVSFEVKPGEVVGIIGRNGAGKSTLLKILSRITEPTEGSVSLWGRVASLLEVGTGFHAELTGRENIYLSGSILGMRKAEIDSRFNEIVDFAEIEKFLDTPVKRYSSGMYVRLAFAVAAHLEPEILVVDEVLAVGDSDFQKKCLGRMGRVASEGRTVLFVSHNMAAVQRLCDRAIVLDKGRVRFNSSSADAIAEYSKLMHDVAMPATVDVSQLDGSGRRGNGLARFTKFELLRQDGLPSSEFLFGEPMRVRMTIESQALIEQPVFGVSFISSDGIELFGTTINDVIPTISINTTLNIYECNIDPMILTPGIYSLRAAIFKLAIVYDFIHEIMQVEITNTSYDLEKTPRGHYVGSFFMKYSWQIRQ